MPDRRLANAVEDMIFLSKPSAFSRTGNY